MPQRGIEGTEAPGGPPPVAVEHGVAEVDDPLAFGFDHPGDLRVAQRVDCGNRAESEWARLDSFPCTHRAAGQCGLVQFAIGLR
jgi:hypothetical protein